MTRLKSATILAVFYIVWLSISTVIRRKYFLKPYGGGNEPVIVFFAWQRFRSSCVSPTGTKSTGLSPSYGQEQPFDLATVEFGMHS